MSKTSPLVVNGLFTSEQHRRSVTFCEKRGTVERVTDFLLLRNKKRF